MAISKAKLESTCKSFHLSSKQESIFLVLAFVDALGLVGGSLHTITANAGSESSLANQWDHMYKAFCMFPNIWNLCDVTKSPAKFVQYHVVACKPHI